MTSLLSGLKPSALISPAYVALQQELHARPRGYGGKGGKWAAGVADVAQGYGCASVLDYGCGQGRLKTALEILAPHLHIEEYDPAIPGKNAGPPRVDLVVCTDVLEHVEPERLSATLDALKSLARKAVFVVVATRPSNKTMADGRNAHLIVESADWWRAQLVAAGFTLHAGPPSPLRKPSRELVAVLTS